jgi:four helix bundle protein
MKTYLFSFEKLEVWKDAHALILLTYTATKKFPTSERFGLSNWMKQSSLDIATNISLGSGPIPRTEQVEFYAKAYSAGMVLLNQALVARDLGYLTVEHCLEYRIHLEMVTGKVNALKKSVVAKTLEAAA